MKIRFSRHAKRRMKLYNISEYTVTEILKNAKVVSNRKQEIVKNVQSSELPIKIVFDVRDDNITIITVFPLKQRR